MSEKSNQEKSILFLQQFQYIYDRDLENSNMIVLKYVLPTNSDKKKKRL